MDNGQKYDLLKSILDGMDALITVCNAENFDLLFLNEYIKKTYNTGEDYVGKKCYTVLQGRTEPCVNCPHRQLLEDPSKVQFWEHLEVTGRTLHKNAKLIDWSPGIKGHLEYAIDITRQKELEKEVDKLFYDPLTEIYSRRYFEENIVKVLQSLSRCQNSLLSLMMIDVDYFKLYNDTYGHINGDVCLRAVAQTIQNSLRRKEDFVARFGGEEFVVVLPNMSEVGAKYIAKKILTSVRELKIAHEKSQTHDCVTVSIGVVSGKPGTCYLRNSYLEAADKLLYEAKTTGRNRCSFGRI